MIPKFRAYSYKDKKIYDVAGVCRSPDWICLDHELKYEKTHGPLSNIGIPNMELVFKWHHMQSVDDSGKLINNFELMQWTGLVDKNEKEIWEGDIVKLPVTGNKDVHGSWTLHEVVYRSGMWITSYITSETGEQLPRGYTAGHLIDHEEYDKNRYFYQRNQLYAVEVIGNIYLNPELLEGADHAP